MGVSALINQTRREVDEDGYLVATLADYAVARQALELTYKRLTGTHIKTELRKLVEVVDALFEKHSAVQHGKRIRPQRITVTYHDLAKLLRVSKDTARRLLTQAVDNELLYKEQRDPGHPLELRMGVALPIVDSKSPLPTVAKVRARVSRRG